MNYTDRRIIEAYSGLFEGLSLSSKIELIGKLSKSLLTEAEDRDTNFYKSFGAFSSGKFCRSDFKGYQV